MTQRPVPGAPRRIAIAGLALTLAALGRSAADLPVTAATSPGSVTIVPGGPAAAWQGGPLFGYLTAGTSPAPAAACVDPSCEREDVLLGVDATYLQTHNVTVHVVVKHTSGSGGEDTWVLDDQGNLLGDSFQDPGDVVVSNVHSTHLVVQVNGDIGAGDTYAGTVLAIATPLTHARPPHDLGFAPQTIVSANFMGQEPQVSIERPGPAGALPGAIDPRRVFIDWPVGSTSNISQLNRSLDGGDSFRMLVDAGCAVRNRPNCLTGGGGDSVERVNGYDGTLFFGDQESLAAEAEASSIDHGDSFPAARQFAATAGGTAVDRQWIATVDAPGFMAGPVDSFEMRAVYAYHIPGAGEYVSGIDTSGIVHPSLIPNFINVGQSGPNRVDTSSGHGRGWLYQGYRQFDPSGVMVNTAQLNAYQTVAGWHTNMVSTDSADSFPWLTLDTAGNAYIAWETGGNSWYAYSLISDPANDPAKGGVPATKWSQKIRINPPALGSTQFPEIIAGDPGRLAVAYLASSDFTGDSGTPPPNTNPGWYTYAAITTNALDPAGKPSFLTGPVSPRVMHTGPICHTGTTCVASMLDRSLADMIDISMDVDGHVGVVSMDNNDGLARADYSMGALGSPFVNFAKLTHGPSLYAAKAALDITIPSGYRSSPPGRATWPNLATGVNLPSLDLRGAGLSTDGTHLFGRIDVADATVAGMTRDLAAYNTTAPALQTASRLEYVLRFDTPQDVVYMAMDQDGSETRRIFGGVLGSANGVTGGSSVKGATYDAQPSHPVKGAVEANTLSFSANLADLGMSPTTPVYSVTAFALAGPAEGSDTTILSPMRQVDSTPPFDGVLPVSAYANGTPRPVLPPAAIGATSLANTARPGGFGAGAAGAVLALSIAALGLGRRRRRVRGWRMPEPFL